MKLVELIQIIPAPTRSALKSGNLATYRISDPTIMGYLRNNSSFAFGRADRHPSLQVEVCDALSTS
jgi:hypothetical protein